MPMYTQIRYPRAKDRKKFTPEARKRTAEKLLELREHLRSEIPAKTINDTLLLATWNLRNFTSRNRIKESFFYVAEVLSAFDIIALQEIGDNLQPMEEVLDILGNRYKFIVTDTTLGNEGNYERLGFIYDSRKVSFKDIAGEVVLPIDKLLPEDRQFARTPFIAAFQARWFKFMLCNVHILYGKGENKKKIESRIAEIEAIAKYVIDRAAEPRTGEKRDYNYILLGDLNIISPKHKTMTPLVEADFKILEELAIPSAVSGEKHYDQIVFKPQPDELELGPGAIPGKQGKKNAGVFEYFKTVFSEDQYKTYLEYYEKKPKDKTDAGYKKYFKTYFRTFQMSDHYPKWVELQIDFSDRYLEHRRDEITEEIKKKKK